MMAGPSPRSPRPRRPEGPADPIGGAHVLPRIREVVPQAKPAVLDEAPAMGHFPQVEAPEHVGPLLIRRLGGNQRRAPPAGAPVASRAAGGRGAW